MATEIIFDPFLPEFTADPFPAYRRLRDADPVHRSPLGFWVLTRYEDCVAVLRDQRYGRSGFEGFLEAVYGINPDQERQPSGAQAPRGRLNYVRAARSMLFQDPPDHTRLRALVSRAFTPRVVEGLRPRIQQIVDELIDRAIDQRSMEVIADFAYPLPVTVISEMLGVPTDDHERIKGWSADIARSLDAIGLTVDPGIVERGRTARQAIGAYFSELLPQRRKHPRQDLLSLLIAAEEHGDKLSEGELLSTCILLYVAGHETTVNLIGNGLLALLRHPDQLARLRTEPELAASAVEELLRYDGPVQRTARVTKTDVEIGGHAIERGAMVVTVIGAANRDPAQFLEPDRLDLSRQDNRHIAFGFGIHFCLGAPLARLEGQIALGALARRLPKIALATENPEWRESQVLRGLKALPITC